MLYGEFIDSLARERCPDDMESCLQALWYDAVGEWHTAHGIVQQMDDVMAARIHAYLHRKEGDEWNARYWHRHAGSEFPQGVALQAEWELLLRELLE